MNFITMLTEKLIKDSTTEGPYFAEATNIGGDVISAGEVHKHYYNTANSPPPGEHRNG